MPILFHPNPGTILLCQYEGFEIPEMVKPRPVLVVSPRSRRNDLVTVAAISTTAPHTILEWHKKITLTEILAPEWPELEIWIKCDMLNTFRKERLDRFHIRLPSGRKYYDRRISDDELMAVRQGIAAFLAP